MKTIEATIKGRRLELDVPADRPDGTRVEIHALELSANGVDDTMSAEAIIRTLAAMDQIEPFEMTEAEREAWENERHARKEREKAEFFHHAESLRTQWE